jgi:hypothetical protein
MPGMMPGMMMPMPMPGMNMGMGMGMPMPPMPMMRMSMELAKDGMVCRLTPMDGTSMDSFRERAEALMRMVTAGMPVVLSCGPMAMMAVPSQK